METSRERGSRVVVQDIPKHLAVASHEFAHGNQRRSARHAPTPSQPASALQDHPISRVRPAVLPRVRCHSRDRRLVLDSRSPHTNAGDSRTRTRWHAVSATRRPAGSLPLARHNSEGGRDAAPLHSMTANRPDPRRWLALAVIVTAQFMVVLDVAIVNVALPTIKTDLGFSQENLQWVVTAYSILFGGVLLLGGRMADLLGRRRLFMAGLALFTVSSLLDGLAWSEGSLIALPRPAGARRGAALAGRAVDPDDDLRRGPGAQPRARHLGRRLRQRRRGRRAARRRADQLAQLVVDLLHQRSRRRARAGADAAARAREPSPT